MRADTREFEDAWAVFEKSPEALAGWETAGAEQEADGLPVESFADWLFDEYQNGPRCSEVFARWLDAQAEY